MRRVFLGATLFILGLGFLVIQWPSFWINSMTLSWIARVISSQGLSTRWKDLDVSIQSLSFTRKHIEISGREICFNSNSLSEEICASQVHFGATFKITGFRLEWEEMGPAQIVIDHANINLEKSQVKTAEAKQSSSVSVSSLVRFVTGTQFRGVQILAKEVILHEGKQTSKGWIDLTLEEGKGENVRYSISSSLERKNAHFSADIHGLIGPDQISASIFAIGKKWAEILPKWRTQECSVILAVPSDLELSRTSVDCSLVVESSLAKQGRVRILSNIYGDQGNLSLEIPQVEKWFASKDQIWNLPAPFHVLKGNLKFATFWNQKFDWGAIPVQMQSKLHSEGQVLDIYAQGTLDFPHSKAQIEVRLDDGQLAMPTLYLSEIPHLFPDSRFQRIVSQPQKNEKKRDVSLPWDWSLRIYTRPNRAMRLLTQFSESPLPVHLDVNCSSRSSVSGNLEVRKFPMELFRHQGVIERIKVKLGSRPEESEIDGLLKVKKSDRNVIIKILGNLERPRFKTESDPPLAESETVAALLFGQPIEKLDPEQKSSVGNIQAALQDHAVDLASFLVFASTPVESVHYESATGVFSAKVKIGEGTALTLGADASEFRTIGIRKRLGKYWTIQTDLEHPIDRNARGVSTFIQWDYPH